MTLVSEDAAYYRLDRCPGETESSGASSAGLIVVRSLGRPISSAFDDNNDVIKVTSSIHFAFDTPSFGTKKTLLIRCFYIQIYTFFVVVFLTLC